MQLFLTAYRPAGGIYEYLINTSGELIVHTQMFAEKHRL